MKERIKSGLTEGLQGLSVSSAQHEKYLENIHKEKRSPRYYRALIVTMIFLLLAAVAGAVTVYELVRPKMNQMMDTALHADWRFADKKQYIELMKKYGFLTEDAQINALDDEALSEADRDHAADLIIDSVFGDAIRQKMDPSILQQELYLMPDDETVFTLLYRLSEPNADEQTIKEAFSRWFDAYYDDASDETVYGNDQSAILNENDMREKCDTYLSEVMNFNRSERAQCRVDVTLDEANQLWRVEFEIDGSSLRQALKEEWTTDAYDEKTGKYAWTVWFHLNGDCIGEVNLDDYLLGCLIPAEDYPAYETWGDPYRAFLYCSTAERAAFSEKWKPVVDQFLQEHPEAEHFYKTNPCCQTAYITTRHQYGVPNARAIAENRAVEIAKAAYLQADLQGVSSEMTENRCNHYVLYDVSDADKPLWKVAFTHSVTDIVAGDHMDGYFVVMDAETGEILRQYPCFEESVSTAWEFTEKLV